MIRPFTEIGYLSGGYFSQVELEILEGFTGSDESRHI